MYKKTSIHGTRNLNSLRQHASATTLPARAGKFACALLLLISPSYAQQTESTAPRLGSVSGAVSKARTSEPVKNALITLEAQDPSAANYRAVTDENGRFNVSAVRPGKYIVTARKSGFSFQIYGNGSAPTILSLRESEQLRDINLRLFEPAVISGHVTDEDGDPVRDAEVSALASRQMGSSKKMVSVARSKTDDRGDFRIAGLQPGQYAVKVAPMDPLSSTAASRDVSYVDQVPAIGYATATTYYPNVLDVQQAVPLDLKWGQEMPISISLTRTSTYAVSGRVTGPLDSSISLILRSAHTAGSANSYEAMLRRDGRFVFRHVAPGDYILLASSRASGIYYSARQSVQVGATNVTNLLLPLEPPFALSGRVTIDGPTHPRFLLAVQAIPMDDDSTGAFIARVKDNGTFSVNAIPPGTYAIRTTGLPNDYYLKSATLGREDATKEVTLTRDNAAQPLQLVLSPAGGCIEGVVTDNDSHNIPGAQVALIHDDRSASWDAARGYVIADQHGKFALRGLPPGNYRILAWRSGTLDTPSDAESAHRFSVSAKSVKVEPNGVYQVNVIASDQPEFGQ